jgi:hypothetical protein
LRDRDASVEVRHDRCTALAADGLAGDAATGQGGRCAPTSATARDAASAREVVTRIACASRSCSACASRSAATNGGGPTSSAITSTSEGPAGRSSAAPAGSAATICLAAVTQAEPGPKILSTLGTVAVP